MPQFIRLININFSKENGGLQHGVIQQGLLILNNYKIKLTGNRLLPFLNSQKRKMIINKLIFRFK